MWNDSCYRITRRVRLQSRLAQWLFLAVTLQFRCLFIMHSGVLQRDERGREPSRDAIGPPDLSQGLSLQPQYLPVSVEFPSFVLVVFGLSCKLC